MRKSGLPRPRREAVLDFCLAAERVDLDDRRWLEGATRAARPLLPASEDYAATFATHDEQTSRWGFETRFEHTSLPLIFDGVNEELSESERAIAANLSGITTVCEHLPGHPNLSAALQKRGLREIACVLGPWRGGIVSLYFHLEEPLFVTAEQRRFWQRLGTHLASTTHLRRSLGTISDDEPDAVFGPDGACRSTSGAVGNEALDRLRAHVLARQRLRAGSAGPLELVATWTAVTREGWSVIDRFDADGSHWIVVWENPLGEHNPRCLSPIEARLVERVLVGWTNRDAAAELGLSHASASRFLHSALRKLGVGDVGLLARWRSLELAGRLLALPLDCEGLLAIGLRPAAAEALQGLTPAEREVLTGILQGKTDREIGRGRGTSSRTVANQVRSIFAKLGVDSRRELSCRLGDRSL